ncbi:MAG TPA: LysM peptidoglycan-binding domain-containing protein [Thermoanaerobaculia bacterium]|nr:LysM peptidoglycan-binding domain-containing protein [Thermoanaerobaculia bacterium]
MNRPLSALLLTLLLAPAALRAQGRPAAPPASPPERTGWHTVRPGETLEGIAAQFLGSADRWTEIHRLNPDIRDPHWIAPGRRIRIPSVESVLPAARLSRLSRQVEDQPSPIPWRNAQEGDMLVERDGVRTHQKSSAEMQFLDGARLTLTEDSLVFLHRSGATLRGTPKKSIEIVQGQADLDARAASAALPSPEVEIVLGNTRATSRPDGAGAARTRARKAEEGGAKLMAYGGQSEVEAGGAKVQVPHGMGTSVAAQGPPSPPEPLLPAPVLTAPEPGGERACVDPPLSWQPVPEAASYIVEICRDPACGALIDRHLGETAAQWRPAALPVGELYWRVTARGRSGLDGYPSEAIRLAITSDRPGSRETPAAGVLQAGGPQVRVGDRLFVAPTAKIEVLAEDAGARSASWRPVIGGRTESAWPASWSPGEHTVAAVAEDGCGGRATVAPLSFVVDAEPPAIRWEVGDRSTLEDRLAPDTEQDRRRLRGRRSGGHAPLEAWRSRAGVWQVPVPWDMEPGREKTLRPVEIVSDHPQAFFAAPDTALAADGQQGTLGENRILWVAAEDAGSGVDRLTVRTRVDGDRVVMEVEARDLVGNVSRKEISLRKR